jgi:hypothetical protein
MKMDLSKTFDIGIRAKTCKWSLDKATWAVFQTVDMSVLVYAMQLHSW